MSSLRIAFALAACAFGVAACGGGSAGTSTGSPTPRSSTVLSFLDIPGASVSVTPTPTPAPTRSGQAIVQADLSSATSPQTTIGVLEQIIQDRLSDAGIQSNISQTGDAGLTIDFTGTRSADFVKQVIEAQNLNFRQPIIQATGDIMCKASDGVEFTVPAVSTHETVDDSGTKSDACTATDGQIGFVEWEPAQADVNGSTKTMTQAMIDSSTVEIRSTPQQGTVLLLPFTPEGSSLFAAITGRLRNYPLGIFLGDTLLNAPTVFQQISNGEAELSGQTDDELAVVKAVLKGGALPVPVSVTSITPGSPAP
jgi:hypothetical protein